VEDKGAREESAPERRYWEEKQDFINEIECPFKKIREQLHASWQK